MDPSKLYEGNITEHESFKELSEGFRLAEKALPLLEKGLERMCSVNGRMLKEREVETRKFLGSSASEADIKRTLAKLAILLDSPRIGNPRTPPSNCLPVMSDYSNVFYRLTEVHKKLNTKFPSLKQATLAQFCKYLE